MPRRHERNPFLVDDIKRAVIQVDGDINAFGQLENAIRVEEYLGAARSLGWDIILFSNRHLENKIHKLFRHCFYSEARYFKHVDAFRDWLRFNDDVIFVFMLDKDVGMMVAGDKFRHIKSIADVYPMLKGEY